MSDVVASTRPYDALPQSVQYDPPGQYDRNALRTTNSSELTLSEIVQHLAEPIPDPVRDQFPHLRHSRALDTSDID